MIASFLLLIRSKRSESRSLSRRKRAFLLITSHTLVRQFACKAAKNACGFTRATHRNQIEIIHEIESAADRFGGNLHSLSSSD
jgi:hypothetical protein